MPGTDVTGLGLCFGPAEEGRSWRGRTWTRRYAAVEVNRAMILDYCSLVEDPNPLFWDSDEAPWGLLMTWSMPLSWHPSEPRRPSLAAMEVPLPGRHVINASTDTEFIRPLRAGERVSWVDELLDVSEAKQTRLGTGHFITTRTTYAGRGEKTVAVNTNVLFRYDVSDEVPRGVTSGTRTRDPRSDPPDDLPPVSLTIDYRRVVHNAAATWDWFPGHHDPEYARAQGQHTIYLSTLFFHGFIDRAVSEWVGAGYRLRRREVRIQRSIYAGQTATVRGRREDADGAVTVAGAVVSEDGPCVIFTAEAVRIR